jgi:ABC-type multidrug transport system fused ATPase/permease subunit
MQDDKTLLGLVFNLWSHIRSQRQIQFIYLVVLMLVASVGELISIGAVIPFLGVLTTPERLFDHAVTQPLILWLGLTNPQQLVLPITLLFVIGSAVSCALRLLLLWANTKFAYAVGAELSIDIYRRTLYQPYTVHCLRNSSEVISGISTKVANTIFIINQILGIISSACILMAILAGVFYLYPLIALCVFGGFAAIYMIILLLTRKRLYANSHLISRQSDRVLKTLQEGLGGIRDVLIDGSQNVYCKIYSKADHSLREAQASNAFISASPRYIVEALGITVIAALTYFLVKLNAGISLALPALGGLALSAQRILPLLQQIYASGSGILGSQATLDDILTLLNQPMPISSAEVGMMPLPFEQSIALKNVSFRYQSETSQVLNKLTITIKKGSRVGFIGSTGSGKSTLLDIVMGLLEPSGGTLEIDGEALCAANTRSWQARIAHVPQAIFLSDSTIEENVAFGVPKNEIDFERVRRAASQAQINDVIERWPQQYQTIVGERGVRLSGGQRQRIGIARALYKQADVIVFDEATSALDSETEQAVMQAIDGLNRGYTLLIVAHRLSTLANCSEIIEINKGAVERITNYQNLIKQGRAIA